MPGLRLRLGLNIRCYGHTRMGRPRPFKSETFRACRDLLRKIGQAFEYIEKSIRGSRVSRPRADRHVSDLKHKSHAGIGRGGFCRAKHPTGSLSSGSWRDWHRRCVLSSGLVQLAKPFLVTSGGFHAQNSIGVCCASRLGMQRLRNGESMQQRYQFDMQSESR